MDLSGSRAYAAFRLSRGAALAQQPEPVCAAVTVSAGPNMVKNEQTKRAAEVLTDPSDLMELTAQDKEVHGSIHPVPLPFIICDGRW